MNFWMDNWGVKREKRIIFLYIQNKRWQCFLQRYIHTIKTIKIFPYSKNSLKKSLLIKLSATTKQRIRRNAICCLKNQFILFHRVSKEICLTPPLPVFVFIRSLRIPSAPLPFTTNHLLKRVRYKRWKDLMMMLVH